MLPAIVVWLGVGVAVSRLAWRAETSAFPAGQLSALIAGAGGGFLGGAMLVLGDGKGTAVQLLSVPAAGVVATAMLVATSFVPDPDLPSDADRVASSLWGRLWLLCPLGLATWGGLVAGGMFDSPLIAASTALTLVLGQLYWRHYRFSLRG